MPFEKYREGGPMDTMTLERIASVCGGQYVGEEGKKSEEIKGAVTDSRQVEEGFLFIPVKGERVDGHDFIPSVFERGALAVLSERPLEHCAGPYILVESSLMALKQIAAYYRSTLNIPIVGITGSVGKTSTKEMIASVLSVKYKVLKTVGNFNNEIGLPLTILRIRKEHQAAVVEMGISEFGEMHRLAQIAVPDICVITNIGTCHLENLGDRDGVLQAKTEVFCHLKKDAAVFLNGDDDKLASITQAGGQRPVFYGMGRKACRSCGEDPAAELESPVSQAGEPGGRPKPLILQPECWPEIYMDQVENLGLKGSRAQLHTPKGMVEVEIPIPGAHNLYNAMAAAGVGLKLGLTLEELKEGIGKAQTIAGRSHLIEADGMVIIDDCYNANPMSMKASLDVLKAGHGRTIAVLGDMGELGEQERQLHYEVGAYAAKAGIDVLFCVGELSREMERGAVKAGGLKHVFYAETRDIMLPKLLAFVKPGDTILVKASHFMEFPEVVRQLADRANTVGTEFLTSEEVTK